MAIPFVMIDLDKPRRLRFGMGAAVEFEQLTGQKLMELGDNISVEMCSKLLFVMLKQDDESLTLNDVNKLIDENADNLTNVIEKVGEALSAAFEKKGKSPNGKTPAAK